jgi:hypothetical protein
MAGIKPAMTSQHFRELALSPTTLDPQRVRRWERDLVRRLARFYIPLAYPVAARALDKVEVNVVGMVRV